MKKKILVIDDEEILTRTFTVLLKRSGYEVCTAENGRDAMAVADAENIDLIICDIRMPGINGVETIQGIQNSLKGKSRKDIPVIFISGFTDPKVEAEAKKLGLLAYLEKPFDNAEILGIIRSKLS